MPGTNQTVRFHIAVEADPNCNKTNIVNMKTIQILDAAETYIIPEKYQPIKHHTLLRATNVVAAALKTITKRGTQIRLKVNLTLELVEIYFDSDGNPRIGDDYLLETTLVDARPVTALPPSSNPETIKKQTLQSITKDAVILKFNGITPNPRTWFRNFVKECQRLLIPEERFCEAIRLFLDGIAMDWYQTQWTLNSSEPWETWEESFKNHFCSRGWQDSNYAFNYKYIRGSISEYVIKKLGLLADVDPSLTEKSRVLIVVAGLPPFFYTKLEKDKIITVSDLVVKLNQLDRLGSKNTKNIKNEGEEKSGSTSYNKSGPQNLSRNQKYKPCTHCDKAGRPGLYHPESKCRTCLRNLQRNNNNQTSRPNKNNVKIAHNTELETILNNGLDQKN